MYKHWRTRSGAFSHSVYIKSIDATLWHLVLNSAAQNGVSVSRFVNTALWLFMVGSEPPEQPKRAKRGKRGVRRSQSLRGRLARTPKSGAKS